MTPKQVLAQHIADHHRHLARELPKRATFADLSRAHGNDHYRFSGSLDHWHGPQADLGPGHRPDGLRDGTHVHPKETV